MFPDVQFPLGFVLLFSFRACCRMSSLPIILVRVMGKQLANKRELQPTAAADVDVADVDEVSL